MDRNLFGNLFPAVGNVALRKESVDRNKIGSPSRIMRDKVALRKESVDRNIKGNPYLQIGRQSLSARRAWIEIVEAVYATVTRERSLSARRAWIEMVSKSALMVLRAVALRKESVDRNC